MKFDWSKRPVNQWRALMKRVTHSSWLQSLPFAKATELCDRKRTRLAVILDQDEHGHPDEPVGFFAIQEIRLGPIHTIDLYRGPLWFEAAGTPERFAAFAQEFAREFPRRLLRKRRWLPEWPDSDSARAVLSGAGFRSEGKSFDTLWVDLQHPPDELRSRLDRKWRNALVKAEGADLTIVADGAGKTVDLFLKFYDLHKRLKNFPGRDIDFIGDEIRAGLTLGDIYILWAHHELLPVAAILIVVHGRSASYRASFSTDEGRARNAHNLLMWRGMLMLREMGIRDFDLGGITPGKRGFADDAGFTHFKRGLGGRPWALPGVWS